MKTRAQSSSGAHVLLGHGHLLDTFRAASAAPIGRGPRQRWRRIVVTCAFQCFRAATRPVILYIKNYVSKNTGMVYSIKASISFTQNNDEQNVTLFVSKREIVY